MLEIVPVFLSLLKELTYLRIFFFLLLAMCLFILLQDSIIFRHGLFYCYHIEMWWTHSNTKICLQFEDTMISDFKECHTLTRSLSFEFPLEKGCLHFAQKLWVRLLLLFFVCLIFVKDYWLIWAIIIVFCLAHIQIIEKLVS